MGICIPDIRAALLLYFKALVQSTQKKKKSQAQWGPQHRNLQMVKPDKLAKSRVFHWKVMGNLNCISAGHAAYYIHVCTYLVYMENGGRVGKVSCSRGMHSNLMFDLFQLAQP